MNKGIALMAELVGLKNLKTSHVWRIELDVYEIDSPKVKQLFDLINKPLSVGMVEVDE
jgi:hypothetical protein|tara:strand:- start:416 stop:589 length:174 start_codon:yes stop_codon:yes gene_type:complete